MVAATMSGCGPDSDILSKLRCFPGGVLFIFVLVEYYIIRLNIVILTGRAIGI